MAKAKRKRVVRPARPVIMVKQDDEIISVPASKGAVTPCVGCCFYVEAAEKCTDTEGRSCAGVIFKKQTNEV